MASGSNAPGFFQTHPLDDASADIQVRMIETYMANYDKSWEYFKVMTDCVFDIGNSDFGDDPRVRQSFESLYLLFIDKVLDISKFLDNILVNHYVRENIDKVNYNMRDCTYRCEVMKSGAVKLRPAKRINDFKSDETFEAIVADIEGTSSAQNSKKKKRKNKNKKSDSKLTEAPSQSVKTHEVNNIQNERETIFPTQNSNLENVQNSSINILNKDSQNGEAMDCAAATSDGDAQGALTDKSATNSTAKISNKFIYDLFFEITDNYKNHLEKIFEIQPNVNAKTLQKHIHIRCFDSDSYLKIQNFCNSSNIPFRTRDPRCDRPRKVLVRGLPWNTPVEDIASAISFSGLVPLRISFLRSRKTFNKGQPLNLFVATVAFGPNFDNIYKIDKINNLLVHFTTFKSAKFKQCYNCQTWGHSSLTCKLSSVCLKCAGNHISKDCTRKEGDPLKCCHCSLEHASNWLGCTFHPGNKNYKSKFSKIPPVNSVSINTNTVTNINTKTCKSQISIASQKKAESLPGLKTLVDFPPMTISSVAPPMEATSSSVKENVNSQIETPPTVMEITTSVSHVYENKINELFTESEDSNVTEFFEILREMKNLCQNHTFKDILNTLKEIVEIIKNADTPFMDKLFQIAEILEREINKVDST